MFGVHFEEGLFVAVDPRMHTPTWFSSSVEFKTRDLEAAGKKGWHGWERERSDARRKQMRPEENLQTETVIGFRPDQFLRYVEFERVASGLDCGERLLSVRSDRKEPHGTRNPLPGAGRHPLELKLGLPASDILDIISGAFRLAAAVRGGVAEHHLERHLRRVPGVRHVRHIIEDGKPDFEVEYRRNHFSLSARTFWPARSRDCPRSTFRRRERPRRTLAAATTSLRSFRYWLRACIRLQAMGVPIRADRTLAPHPKCVGRLASNVSG